MKLSIDAALTFNKNDAVILFVDDQFEYRRIPSKLSFMRTLGSEAYFKELKKVLFIPSSVNPDVVIVPVLKNGDIATAYRKAGAESIRCAQSNQKSKIKLVVPEDKNITEEELVSWLSEGVILGSYNFEKYKTSQENDFSGIKEVVLLATGTKSSEVLSRNELICTCVNECRDMVNDTTEAVNPETMEMEVRKLGRLKSVSIKIINERQLKAKKMNLILSVGKGASYAPRMAVVTYKGNPGSKKWSAIVGKGVTFDTGGLNLKTSAGILDMRSDMGGAATTIFTLKTAAKLGIKQNIYGVVPLVENSIGANSYKPGDIIESYSGKTVQILNTDAEGRLILADALAYTEKVLKPDHIIDFATLTGACLVTFGWEYAALLATDDSLAANLSTASRNTGEKLWRLPFDTAFDQKIKGDVADLTNISSDKKAGTIIGGTFLKQFINSTPFAHIDIAGTGWLDQPGTVLGKYATGFGIRLMIDYFQNLKH